MANIRSAELLRLGQQSGVRISWLTDGLLIELSQPALSREEGEREIDRIEADLELDKSCALSNAIESPWSNHVVDSGQNSGFVPANLGELPINSSNQLLQRGNMAAPENSLTMEAIPESKFEKTMNVISDNLSSGRQTELSVVLMQLLEAYHDDVTSLNKHHQTDLRIQLEAQKLSLSQLYSSQMRLNEEMMTRDKELALTKQRDILKKHYRNKSEELEERTAGENSDSSSIRSNESGKSERKEGINFEEEQLRLEAQKLSLSAMYSSQMRLVKEMMTRDKELAQTKQRDILRRHYQNRIVELEEKLRTGHVATTHQDREENEEEEKMRRDEERNKFARQIESIKDEYEEKIIRLKEDEERRIEEMRMEQRREIEELKAKEREEYELEKCQLLREIDEMKERMGGESEKGKERYSQRPPQLFHENSVEEEREGSGIELEERVGNGIDLEDGKSKKGEKKKARLDEDMDSDLTDISDISDEECETKRERGINENYGDEEEEIDFAVRHSTLKSEREEKGMAADHGKDHSYKTSRKTDKVVDERRVLEEKLFVQGLVYKEVVKSIERYANENLEDVLEERRLRESRVLPEREEIDDNLKADLKKLYEERIRAMRDEYEKEIVAIKNEYEDKLQETRLEHSPKMEHQDDREHQEDKEHQVKKEHQGSQSFDPHFQDGRHQIPDSVVISEKNVVPGKADPIENQVLSLQVQYQAKSGESLMDNSESQLALCQDHDEDWKILHSRSNVDQLPLSELVKRVQKEKVTDEMIDSERGRVSGGVGAPTSQSGTIKVHSESVEEVEEEKLEDLENVQVKIKDEHYNELLDMRVSMRCEITTYLSRYGVKRLSHLVKASNEELLEENMKRLQQMITELEEVHRRDIKELRSSYEAQIQQIEEAFQAKEKELYQLHQDELDKLKQYYEDLMRDLTPNEMSRDLDFAHSQNLVDLQNQHELEINNLRKDFADKLENLEQLLKESEETGESLKKEDKSIKSRLSEKDEAIKRLEEMNKEKSRLIDEFQQEKDKLYTEHKLAMEKLKEGFEEERRKLLEEYLQEKNKLAEEMRGREMEKEEQIVPSKQMPDIDEREGDKETEKLKALVEEKDSLLQNAEEKIEKLQAILETKKKKVPTATLR